MPTMTPADTDFVDSARLRIDTQVFLRQAPQEVWNVLVDNEGWPDWFRSCKAARTTSDPPDGVGSTRWMHIDMFKVNERIIAWEEPACWGFTILDANLPVADTIVEMVQLEPDATGTQLTHTAAVNLKRWSQPLTLVFRWRFKRLFETSFSGLQPHLDTLSQ